MLDGAFIAIDLGGTIEDTWPQKRSWFASRGFDLGPSPLSRQEVIELTGRDEALYLQMVKSIYSDESILRHSLCAGSEEALRNLARSFSIILLSSRPESQRQVTLEWLCKHAILNMITEVVLIGSNVNKLAWCYLHRVPILVDDDIRHLESGDDEQKTIRIHYTASNSVPPHLNPQILVACTWREVCQCIWTSQSLITAAAHQAASTSAELPLSTNRSSLQIG